MKFLPGYLGTQNFFLLFLQLIMILLQIVKVQKHGVPFTLTVAGFGFPLCIDLVPCIVMDKSQWPSPPSRQNPFNNLKQFDEFFLVPKKPKADHAHLDRYWGISFDKQDRKLMFDRLQMKPAIRIFKVCIEGICIFLYNIIIFVENT